MLAHEDDGGSGENTIRKVKVNTDPGLRMAEEKDSSKKFGKLPMINTGHQPDLIYRCPNQQENICCTTHKCLAETNG